MTAEILTGDCLSVLASMPGRQWDHVITDPPYEAEAPIKTKRKRKAEGLDYAAGCDRAAVAKAIAERCRRWAVVWCACEETHLWRFAMACAPMRYVRELWCICASPTPQLTGDRPGQPGEVALLFHASARPLRWNGGGRSGRYHYHRDLEPSWHTTPKAQALVSAIVRDFTDPGESVLDLFAGSAAIGKAALRLGRSYTGIEVREDWAERARQDLAGIQQTEFSADGKPRQGRIDL